MLLLPSAQAIAGPAQATEPSPAVATEEAEGAPAESSASPKPSKKSKAKKSSSSSEEVGSASLETAAVPTTGALELGTEPPAETTTLPLPTAAGKVRKLAADPGAQKCLATAIYFEARGEPKRGQTAVAQVILNRASTKGFPKSICEVVYQGSKRKTGCQFSFTCDKIPDKIREKKAWAKAEKIAKDVLKGKTLLPELIKATHYHATYVKPRWAPKMKKLAKIGVHIFYDA
jgi:spore germination cell wall hydrolase CwlJ-like protein